MGIQVKCPTCEKAYNLRDSQAGAKVVCRNCAEQFFVPGAAPLPSAPLSRSRREEESSPAPRRSRSPSKGSGGDSGWMLIILLVVSGLFLLCVLVGAGGYFLIIRPIQKEEEEVREKARLDREKDEAAEKKERDRVAALAQKERERQAAEAQIARENAADPRDLTMAINRLQANFRTRDTANWIWRQQIDRNMQPEVARALATASTITNLEVFAADEIFKALGKWATREQVPLLMDTVDKQHFGIQSAALDALIRLRDPQSLGRLLAFYNDPNRQKKIEESFRLMVLENPTEAINALLAVLPSNNQLGRNAAEFLCRVPVDPTHQTVIAAALASAAEGNTFYVREYVKALSIWATRDQTPQLMNFAVKRRDDVQGSAIDGLLRLRDPRSYGVLVGVTTDPGRKLRIEDVLKAMAAENPKGTTDSLQATLTENTEAAKNAAEYLSRQPVDPARQKAIAAVLANVVVNNTDPARNKEILVKALAVWATKDEVPQLIAIVMKERFATKGYAVDALLRLKDPRSVPVLKTLVNDPQRGLSVRAVLKEMGAQ